MGSIWTMGELLVEIMRTEVDVGLDAPALFRGPFPSGAPAIFIDTVAKLGVAAGIYGGVADDAFGRCVTERLESDGVDCSHVGRFDGATAVAFVAYSSDGSRKFIYHFGKTPAVEQRFTSPALSVAPSFFHVMGCSLMASDHFREEIIKAALWFAGRGARISFDPNIRPELLGDRTLDEVVGPVMERTAVLLPGVPELAMLGGTPDVRQAVSRLFERSTLELIVLKLGKKGARIFTRNSIDESVSVPAYPVTEVDPTGAGDCFDAGFLAGLASGYEPARAGAVAAAAGALNAAAFGPMEGKITAEIMEEVK